MSNSTTNIPQATSSPYPWLKDCQTMAERWFKTMTANHEDRVSVRGIKAGYGELQWGVSLENEPLCVAGKKYTNGLATHAQSEILVESAENITRFHSIVGHDQNKGTLTGNQVRLQFSVEVGGREIWRSGLLDLHGEETVDLALPPDTKAIVLKAISVDGTIYLAHADWAEAWVEMAGGDRIKLGHESYAQLFPTIPFSFTYRGKSSQEVLSTWKKRSSSRIDAKSGATLHVVSWQDPESGLECRMELSQFDDYPALEWVLYFRNNGKADTAILENIQALDTTWKLHPKINHENIEARVYRSRGSTFKISDFEYIDEKLLVNENIEMTAGGGRPSQHWLPFFNTDLGDKGIITAIGWSGQWACRMHHQPEWKFRITAGMEKTHLLLHPGEEIRSPRILQLFWKQDRLGGHNLLRKFLLEHHTPRIDNKPITGPFTLGHWGGMQTQGQLDRIAVYKRERLPMDYFWLDAGWYGHNSTYSPDEFIGDWASHTGDWRVNPKAHPNGLKPISAAARDAGMKFLLWVEPLRAIKGTVWPTEHPDWFLGCENPNMLLNLGKPEALQGAIDLISGLIREHGVDLYREDFNIDPLPFWRNNDTPDRQGMTEIRFVENVYIFWDTLLERHPGLIIDNCCSGGRRIDLETISRSVALWRSDFQCYPECDPVGAQVHNLGLSYWIPLHGSGTWASMPTRELHNTYRVRSTMGPTFQLATFPREAQPIQEDYPWDWFRQMCADYLRARPYFVGDYYPLMEPHITNFQNWAVYQMDRPDLTSGFVMAFRRKDTPWEKGTFHLHALDPNATYEIEDADTKTITLHSGQDLLKGLEIALPIPDSSALLFYKKR